MRKHTRKYTGTVLLSSAVQRLAVIAVIVALMWLLSAWALGWL